MPYTGVQGQKGSKTVDIAKSDPRFAGRRPALPQRRPGNWKLAYADFLTALCAFFLVMWMVHGVSAQDKAELADQFSPSASVQTETHSVSQVILDSEALLPFLAHLRIEETPSSLRIELTDYEESALFESASTSPNSKGSALLSAVGTTISMFDYPVRVEGHTDSQPMIEPHYSNWDLSTGRANAARRALINAGMSSDQIVAVIGLADTKPLLPQSPDLPANRRISIVLDLSPQ